MRLRDRWNCLADACESDSVFLRHEWFDAAWQWLKCETDLFVLSVTRGDEIIGLWPLVTHRRKHRRTTVRAIEFMTVPDTQVCDVICSPENHEIVVDALKNYLRANRRTWDLCSLEKLPAESRTINCLQARQEDRVLAFDIDTVGFNPQVNLTGTWPDFYARRSRRLKKGNNLVANHLKKKFSDIEMRFIRASDVDQETAIQALQTVIGVSRRSWKSETGGSLDKAGPGAFIERLTSHAFRQNWLSLWILELDGQPVAIEYQLSYAGNVHALRGDFDLEWSDLSPGTFLNWKLLEKLFDEDLQCYHMGPGNNAYKMRWAEETTPLCKATAYSSSARGRIISMVERKLRPFAKRVVARAKGYLASDD